MGGEGFAYKYRARPFPCVPGTVPDIEMAQPCNPDRIQSATEHLEEHILQHSFAGVVGLRPFPPPPRCRKPRTQHYFQSKAAISEYATGNAVLTIAQSAPLRDVVCQQPVVYQTLSRKTHAPPTYHFVGVVSVNLWSRGFCGPNFWLE